MRALLLNFLSLECRKHISRFHEYLHELDEDTQRKTKRLGTPVPKEIRRPPYWALDPRFNPFYVRARRNLELYSYTLAAAVRKGKYEPAVAVKHSVPKEDGDKREVGVFQIPDAALSRLV